jgi:hypothetical protein
MKHYFGVVLKPQRIVAREIICTNLVKDMIDPIHKLHDLLPFTVNRIRGRETSLNDDRIYNFKCRTERFKTRAIVFAIDKYNLSMH